MHINFIIFHFLFSLFFLIICKKLNILVDNKTEAHKKYSSKSRSFLIGGVLTIIFLNYYYFFIEKNVALCFFISSIFLIGLMSDLKRINSVSIRFLLQIIFIVCFINYLNVEINSTKIIFVDELLKNQLVNIFFVSFCLLVLINGSNFIDGINCNAIIYFLIILLTILIGLDNFIINKEILINMILILILILFLNAFGFVYLGDSGSYTISLFVGLFLINFSQTNNAISPYLMIVLLWYPCFELLFSMIRRLFKQINTYEPDTFHLHHLIYKKFKISFTNKNNLLLHILTSTSINLYNLIIFVISLNYIYNSEILMLIMAMNIFLYSVLYNYLKKKIA